MYTKECMNLKTICQNCHKEIRKNNELFVQNVEQKQEEETSTEKANQLNDEQKEDVQEKFQKNSSYNRIRHRYGKKQKKTDENHRGGLKQTLLFNMEIFHINICE